MKQDKISPSTPIRMLKNYLTYTIATFNKKKKKKDIEWEQHIGEIKGISDCICILMKKYDKEYAKSLKISGLDKNVRSESNL